MVMAIAVARNRLSPNHSTHMLLCATDRTTRHTQIAREAQAVYVCVVCFVCVCTVGGFGAQAKHEAAQEHEEESRGVRRIGGAGAQGWRDGHNERAQHGQRQKKERTVAVAQPIDHVATQYEQHCMPMRSVQAGVCGGAVCGGACAVVYVHVRVRVCGVPMLGMA